MKAQWWLPDARATQRLGDALARSLRWDEQLPRLLYLSGELGAGKTTLAAAVLHALGVEESVRSPSYALIEAYPTAAGQAV
ncbi:MAG TPA: tRNA (adenosine(37)-N6)-threonylcarbamoyltransferase complex ATPase subunit type 1 TsaE, partial [Steroidobacteraceae bacterium]